MITRNGTPTLLDHNGNPIPLRNGVPDGAARPGGIALPHGWAFVARQTGGSNTFWHDRWDEANRHSREDAEAMPRDAYLMSLVGERQRALINLNWHLVVPDEKDRFQTRVKDGMTRMVKSIQLLPRMLDWWSQAIWFGRYGVQVQWVPTMVRESEDQEKPEPKDSTHKGMIQAARRGDRVARYALADFLDGQGERSAANLTRQGNVGGDHVFGRQPVPKGRTRKGYTIARALPVHGDKIGHQEDGTPYVLVNAAESDKLQNASIITTTMMQALSLRGTWRERFLIHRQFMRDAEFWSPDMAEAVHGVGIRSGLFWQNFLKMEWLGNISDYFDRIGMGVTVWYYPAGNAQALAEIKQVAAQQSTHAHLFVPRSADNGKDTGTGVERVEVPTSGAEALRGLIDLVDTYMERYVVGQEASSGGSTGGLGNEENAKSQRTTKIDIIKQDAAFLGETITGCDFNPGLLSIMQKYTYPEADFPVSWVFDVESGESDKKLQSGKTIVEMGVDIKEDELLSAAGFSRPADGDKVVKGKSPDQGAGGMPGMPAPGAVPGGAEPPGGVPGQEPAEPQPEGDFLANLQGGEEPEQFSRGHTIAAIQYLRSKGRDDLAERLLQRTAEVMP